MEVILFFIYALAAVALIAFFNTDCGGHFVLLLYLAGATVLVATGEPAGAILALLLAALPIRVYWQAWKEKREERQESNEKS